MVELNGSRALSWSSMDRVGGFFKNGAGESSAREKVNFGIFCYYRGEVSLL